MIRWFLMLAAMVFLGVVISIMVHAEEPAGSWRVDHSIENMLLQPRPVVVPDYSLGTEWRAGSGVVIERPVNPYRQPTVNPFYGQQTGITQGWK